MPEDHHSDAEKSGNDSEHSWYHSETDKNPLVRSKPSDNDNFRPPESSSDSETDGDRGEPEENERMGRGLRKKDDSRFREALENEKEPSSSSKNKGKGKEVAEKPQPKAKKPHRSLVGDPNPKNYKRKELGKVSNLLSIH